MYSGHNGQNSIFRTISIITLEFESVHNNPMQYEMRLLFRDLRCKIAIELRANIKLRVKLNNTLMLNLNITETIIWR